MPALSCGLPRIQACGVLLSASSGDVSQSLSPSRLSPQKITSPRCTHQALYFYLKSHHRSAKAAVPMMAVMPVEISNESAASLIQSVTALHFQSA
jgi:hypothetical protein